MTTSSFNKIISSLSGAPLDYSNEVRNYAIDLEVKGLPIIFSTEHLALLIGVPIDVLRDIIKNSTPYYTNYRIRKKTGGYRWILAPNITLKAIQSWIKCNILDKVPIVNEANGFVSQRSILTNARNHINSQVVLNVDLYKFFDSIHVKRVFGLLVNLGYIKNLAYDIALLLCTIPPDKYKNEILNEGVINFNYINNNIYILPQGSPASPVITNIICYKLDKKLSGLVSKLGCSYSRYADDLTFSGDKSRIPSINTIRKIITSEGFYINTRKVKYLTNNKKQLVTGIVVNREPKVDKKLKREINTHLHYCLKYGVHNHLKFLENKGQATKSNYKQWLLGNIFFINSIEKPIAALMLEKFFQINWEL